jgi:MFS family permease
VAWIGSVQVFLLFFVGVFTGRLADAGFFRPLAVLGSMLIVAGTMASSVCTQYWQILLAQGVCVGLGNGCLFCPVVAVSSSYFDKHRSIAIGLQACGSATGGVVYPSIVRELLPRLGLAWTIRIIGFLQLAGLIVGVVTVRPRLPPRQSGRLVEWAVFKEAQFVYFALGSFLVRYSKD